MILTPVVAQIHYRFTSDVIALWDKRGGVPIALIPEREDRTEQEAIALAIIAALNERPALIAQRDAHGDEIQAHANLFVEREHSYAEERRALTAQRDALVGACEAAGDYLGGIAYHHPHLVTEEIMQQLRAALALVRGEKGDR